jgi:hypothetical protein
MSICFGLCFCQLAGAANVTPAQWLQKQTKPVFRPNHTLPPLGQMHCINPPYDVRIELAGNFGFAMKFDRGYTSPAPQQQLFDSCNANPSRYKAAAMIANQDPRGFGPLPAGFYLSDYPNDLSHISPEMGDAAFQLFIDNALYQIGNQVNGLQSASTRLALIDNWTESGVNVPAAYYNTQDPKVLAAKGNQTWVEYISKRKAHYDSLLHAAINKNYPNALYTCFVYDGASGDPYEWDWKYMKVTEDYPAPSIYFNFFGYGFTGPDPVNSGTVLNKWLRYLAVQIAEGTPYSYGWLSAGFSHTDVMGDPNQGMYADLDLWIGYLKVIYTLGMLGATTTGEFDCSVNWSSFDEASPPKYLDQMPVLGQAHALFSWLEPVLRNSDILPGPWTRNGLPVYEFPVNGAAAQTNTHIVARKVRNQDKWLICAWTAESDKTDKTVSTNIPILGAYTMTARPCGTVMLVEKTASGVTSTQYDVNRKYPSLTASQIDTNQQPPQSYDLVVTAISSAPAEPITGQPVRFGCTVKNQGGEATPAGTIIGVAFSINGQTVAWSDTSTSSLAAGASRQLTANGGPSSGNGAWTPQAAGTIQVTAIVDDVNRLPNEADESNNTFSASVTVQNGTTSIGMRGIVAKATMAGRYRIVDPAGRSFMVSSADFDRMTANLPRGIYTLMRIDEPSAAAKRVFVDR